MKNPEGLQTRPYTTYIHSTPTKPLFSPSSPSQDISYHTSFAPLDPKLSEQQQQYHYSLFPPPFTSEVGGTAAVDGKGVYSFDSENWHGGNGDVKEKGKYTSVAPSEYKHVDMYTRKAEPHSHSRSPSHLKQPQELRSDSKATVWPHCSPSRSKTSKPAKPLKIPWWKQAHPTNTDLSVPSKLVYGYRRGKKIYKDGPDGDTQQLLDLCSLLWREKKERAAEKQRRALQLEVSALEPVVNDLQTDQAAVPGKHTQTDSEHPSAQESTGPRLSLGGLSTTSQEVPIIIDSSTPQRPHVDLNKPQPSLPPHPRAHLERNEPLPVLVREGIDRYKPPLATYMIDGEPQPAPVRQAVKLNKPLPDAPKPHPKLVPGPERKPQVSVVNKTHMVGFAAAGFQCPTSWQGEANPGHGEHMPTGHGSSSLWHSIAEKRAQKTHEALKSTISTPQSLVAETRTANIAADCGGVGGPAAASSRPLQRYDVHLTPKPRRKDNQVRKTSPLGHGKCDKGKQEASDPAVSGHWREKIASAGRTMSTRHKRCRDSDASFACVGLPEGDAAVHIVQDAGPSRYNPILREGSNRDTRHEDGDPEPQFRGKQGGRNGTRDTGFYQPYHDVIEEYSH